MNTQDISSIYHLVEKQCKIDPSRISVVFNDEEWSYRELNECIIRLTHNLIEAGFDRSIPIAIYAQKNPEIIAAIFAVSALGGIFVPVNPVLKSRQINRIIKDCNTNIFVVPSRNSSKFSDICRANLNLTILALDTTEADEVPHGTIHRNTQCVDIISDEIKRPHPVGTLFHELAAILYTSGSTGFPKGVMLSNANLIHGAASVSEYLGITADDRLLVLLPISFDYGLNQIISAFSAGATTILFDYLLPRDAIDIIVTENVTGVAAVPHVWNRLVNLSWPLEAIQSIRYITNSGGSISRALSSKLRTIFKYSDIFLMYGFTEAFRSTYLPPDKLEIKPDSIGIPIPGAEIFIARADGEKCKDNEVGELIHGGLHVSLGYWNNPSASFEKFYSTLSNGQVVRFARSGDLAYRDSDGYFYFVARNSELIKTMGYRVSPQEVEAILLENPLITEAAVFGLHQDDGSQNIVAVLTKAKFLLLADFKRYCIREMPSYMVPTYVIFVDNFSINQNGKIDMTKVRSMAKNYLMLSDGKLF